jgi:hypothetical protein
VLLALSQSVWVCASYSCPAGKRHRGARAYLHYLYIICLLAVSSMFLPDCRNADKVALVQPDDQLRLAVSPREQWLLERTDSGRVLVDLQKLHNVSTTVWCTKQHVCPECRDYHTGLTQLTTGLAERRLISYSVIHCCMPTEATLSNARRTRFNNCTIQPADAACQHGGVIYH